MLKKFVHFFIVFGLSFLISDVFGWTEQGKAFLYINLGCVAAWMLIIFIVAIVYAAINKQKALAAFAYLCTLLSAVLGIGISLFATWCATKLFGVDFYIAYQIMAFGMCLVPVEKKKKD